MIRKGLRCLALLLALAVGAGAISPASLSAGEKTTHVKGYTRKDGTVVKPHERKVSARKGSPAARPPPVAHAATASAKSDRCENCENGSRYSRSSRLAGGWFALGATLAWDDGLAASHYWSWTAPEGAGPRRPGGQGAPSPGVKGGGGARGAE